MLMRISILEIVVARTFITSVHGPTYVNTLLAPKFFMASSVSVIRRDKAIGLLWLCAYVQI